MRVENVHVDADFMYGVGDAVKKLRPDAKFEIQNTEFTKWDDPNGLEPPSWDEILKIVEDDERIFLSYAYARNRKTVYEDKLGSSYVQLDALWNALENDDIQALKDWHKQIKEIKERYPKPKDL